MSLNDLVPWKWGEKKVPVKREDEQPVYGLQRSVNQLFDNFFSDFGLTPFGALGEPFGTFQPRIDMSENDQEITVSAELPEMDEHDIEVALAGDMLTLSGEKKEEKEDKGQNYYRVERSYGAFRRSIPLPCEVERDKVEATFKKGVLTITLPKTPEAQSRTKKITIKAG